MGRSLRFLDSDNLRWEVHEATSAVSLADARPRRTSRLYFFSGQTTLKLEVFPSDWDSLPPILLEDLRRKATPVSSFRDRQSMDQVELLPAVRGSISAASH